MKQEPKIGKEVSTGEYFLVFKYKDLGEGKFIAKSKRKLNEEELKRLKQRASK